MKLFEQTYSNTNRLYWRGTKQKTTSLKFSTNWSNIPIGFFTTDLYYALLYTKNKTDHGSLQLCKINKPLNIFNAKSSLDRKYLLKKFPDDLTENDLDNLASYDWMRFKIGRSVLIDAVHSLKYRGFFNFEQPQTWFKSQKAHAPAIGLFYEEDVDLLESYTIEEAKEKIPEVKEAFEREKQFAISEALGSSYKSALNPEQAIELLLRHLNTFLTTSEILELLPDLEKRWNKRQDYLIESFLALKMKGINIKQPLVNIFY